VAELVEQARLADARIARHEDGLAAAGQHLPEPVEQHAKLALASHVGGQAALAADLDARARAARPEHLVRLHRRVALHGEPAQINRVEESVHRARGRLGRHHAARLRRLLHPCGEVGGVAHRRVVHAQVVADAPDDHGARVEADAHGERQAALHAQRLGVLLDRALDAEGRVHRASRAVLVRYGRAEKRHDPVARVLVDGALEAVDLGGDQRETAVHDRVDLLRIPLLGERREPRQVGEQHGHLAPLALDGRARLEDLLGEVLWRVGRGPRGCRRRGGR